MPRGQRDQISFELLRDLLKDIAKWGLLYVPPSTLLVTLFFDRFHDVPSFFQSFLKSMYIGEFVLIFSLMMGYLLSIIESILFETFKKTPPERSDIFHAVRSLIFLVPGLFLAFKSLEYVSPLLNWPYHPPSIGQYKYGIFVGIASIGVWVMYYLFSLKRASELKIQLLEKGQLNSKISALTPQMNPHLLFNALNTVAATIPDNPDAAEKMVVDLAGLYRKTLEATRTDFHSLARELDLIKAYLTIEKARFGDRLNFQTIFDNTNLETMVIPSLILQPIVENAVKHGLSSLEKGGTVFIKIASINGSAHLEVEDTGVGFANSKAQGTGTGLDNCRRRLDLLYDGKAQLHIEQRLPSGTRVRIEIPLNLLVGS
jgi:two-component sensor histidine kinase